MGFSNSTITGLITPTAGVQYLYGTYSRETHKSSVERSQALMHMINACVFYLSKLSEAVDLANETLGAHGKFFFKARAR